MKAQQPFFSIITPTFNRVRFLPEMLASVKAQRFEEFEHIVVDDGSSDGTEELMAPFVAADPRLHYIKQENKGRSAARNVGIAAAKGRYICFLDSDDLWSPKHLETIYQRLKDETEAKFYHTGLIWFYDDRAPEQLVNYADRKQFASDVEYVVANQFAPDCVCIHRSILEEHRFDPQLFINEDIELWARIASQYPVVAVDGRTAKLRVHDGNTDKEHADSVTPRMKAFEQLMKNPKVRQQLSKAFILKRKKSLHELLVRQHERNGQRWPLVKELLLFLVRYPSSPRNSAKLVTLVYNLPGGPLLKRLMAKANTPSDN